MHTINAKRLSKSSPRLYGGVSTWLLAIGIVVLALGFPLRVQGAGAVDPGARGGSPGAGAALSGLTADETAFFNDGQLRFLEVETVTGASNTGLGPRFNSNQCASCHAQPAIGGTSPANNPLIAVASLLSAQNSVPWFIASNGPIREARFQRQANGHADGNVHALFVITGRSDAVGCNIAQPSFTPPGDPLTGRGGNPNIVFRIPTPVFGAGLIEAIPDSVILANMAANASAKQSLSIAGHPNSILSGNVNTSGNDGTITRFGWKAQNKSLLMFAGEAYNVEMGISNQLFPQKRDETPGCTFNATPDDTTNFTPSPATATGVVSDIEAFANFMRLLAPPTPAPATPSSANGRAIFEQVGCSLCHTPTLQTASAVNSGSAVSPSAALSNQSVNLFSDLIVHHMGARLADGITQGAAGPDEFRTAPLWGLGQRLFFLHDGRTTNLIEAIAAHRGPGSEANGVIAQYEQLSAQQTQDLLNFLRSL